MRAGEPSRTAEYMALFRAVESCQPEGRRLFSDPFAIGFLTPGLRVAASVARLPGLGWLVPRLIDARASGPRVSALLRTRLIDDALVEALAKETRQVVLLGAGYDSRPYRTEGIQAARVFEVDHPTTQAVKRGRLERMLGSLPANVAYVAVDFVREDLGAALLEAGYNPAERTFFIWEGVTNYLNAIAVDATLRLIASDSGPGSRLSFTYIHRGLLDGSARFPGSEPWVKAVQGAGEPFTFGLHPAELRAYLAERGLRLLSDISTAEALKRYRPNVGNAAAPPAFYRVALAEVQGHS
jgi:methyltransferase (TIGR00027 family)